MGLLDSTSEEPRSKLLRYGVSGVVLALLVAAGLWYVFRFHAERRTVEEFLDTLVGGDTQQAYRLWKPQASYSYNDFLQDWGASSYSLKSASGCRACSLPIAPSGGFEIPVLEAA